MLDRIGAKSIEALFDNIPENVRLKRSLDLPPALSEMELEQHVHECNKQTTSVDEAVCFLGGGAYDHFIPAVVDAVASRSEYYTAYTPYQAEASQGSLQAFFEYQTMICQLTGMDVANASLYEGGSAVAEAVIMAMAISPKRNKVLIAKSLHPEYRTVLRTYAANLDLHIEVLPTPNGFVNPDDLSKQINDDTLCVIVQHPNFFGTFEEVNAISELCQEKGALFVVSFDPISLGMLKKPGDYGADIAIGEGQCLGNPLVYGGPYLGLLACRQEYVRKMPGRLVGETTDERGKRCWVLTLQTREQHIRREKATSNICTNQGLFALRSTVYLAALGPQGLKETADLCFRKAHYLADQLCELPGVKMRFEGPFFNVSSFFKEFTVQVKTDVSKLLTGLANDGFLAGLGLKTWYSDLADCITIAVTEKRTRQEMDNLVDAWKKHST